MVTKTVTRAIMSEDNFMYFGVMKEWLVQLAAADVLMPLPESLWKPWTPLWKLVSLSMLYDFKYELDYHLQ